MNPLTKNRLIGLALAVLLFAADQATKGYILNVLQLDLGQSHYIMPIFQFTLTHNYGVSLGMLTATSQEMRWGLVALTSVIAVVVTVWMVREKLLADIIPLAMILGGALGNIKDRYEYGYVVDFLDLHFGEFRPFLIFNIADAAITIGVLIILARSLFVREKAPEEKPADTVVEN
ncbi:Lipoprotein signal peptidase [Tsuneonella dongtanensis]|uniref:Lipoprotein signal peptidase n=1 Tax=Tsuneonella dongtanensis TaxID=692370 RepID=A0A1B2AAM8_9SPHN|nr:signal peptidase II [Tsuneonella dongtanensis]ANY19161.1 Lipoprotein signal peptidase [Tsuneonella dongtanensis]